MLVTKSEYIVTLANGEQKKITADSMKEVCDALKTEDAVISIVKDHTVEQYNIPDKVRVNVVVNTLVAQECGCHVYPRNEVLVDIGDTMTLSAIAGTGWKFKEWKSGDETVSTSPEALIRVTSPDAVVYTAVFTADAD